MSSARESMSAHFRKLLQRPGLIRTVNVYDPITARIAEVAGFDAIALGGFQLGTHLCMPEPMLTMTEVIESARLITRSVQIPIKVDCGAGFGDPVHVARTIRESEAAGIACIHIEDQLYPKRAHYHRAIEHVITAEEMVDKIRAALAVRNDADFVLVGRTDAMRTHGLAEGIRRANLYAEAGCDMVEFFPNSLDEVKLAIKEIKAPSIYVNNPGNRVGRPILSWKEIEDLGYKMAQDAGTCLLAATRAVGDALKHYMKEGRPPDAIAGDRETRQRIEDLSGLPELYEIEQKTTERKA